MNLLVTGGCGFIGSNFIRQRLIENRSPLKKLVNFDKLTYAGNLANLSDLKDNSRYIFIRGDIGDETLVLDCLSGHRIDAVVNFAAESHVDRSIDSPEVFFQTNVVGTLRLLNAVRRYWVTLDASRRGSFRFLHVSSDEVYGSLAFNDPPFTEKSPLAPNSPYAASKAASNLLMRAYERSYLLPILTTNCSNNYGPFQFPEKLIPLVILNALEGRPVPLYGDGQQVRDWLHVHDHASAIWLALNQGRIGEVYNIGSRCACTNLEVAHRICAQLDSKIPRKDGRSYSTQVTFVPDRPGHDRRYAIDCTKLQREFDWKPTESFETGLAKTIDWYLTHRSWCDEITTAKYARHRLGSPTSIS